MMDWHALYRAAFRGARLIGASHADAEDAAQEVCLRAWRVHGEDGIEHPTAYGVTAGRNRYISQALKSARQTPFFMDFAAPSGIEVWERRADARSRIGRIIALLRPVDRRILRRSLAGERMNPLDRVRLCRLRKRLRAAT